MLDIVQWVVQIIESNKESNSSDTKFDDTLPFLEQELEFISPGSDKIAGNEWVW